MLGTWQRRLSISQNCDLTYEPHFLPRESLWAASHRRNDANVLPAMLFDCGGMGARCRYRNRADRFGDVFMKEHKDGHPAPRTHPWIGQASFQQRRRERLAKAFQNVAVALKPKRRKAA